jgi:hypothetical protein
MGTGVAVPLDRVHVTGISGTPRTLTFKISISCAEGFIGADMLSDTIGEPAFPINQVAMNGTNPPKIATAVPLALDRPVVCARVS